MVCLIDFHSILTELIYTLFRNFTQIYATKVVFTWCSVRKFHFIGCTNKRYDSGDHLVISQKVLLKRLQYFDDRQDSYKLVGVGTWVDIVQCSLGPRT